MKLVGYIRVSKKDQKTSGLGLEAQSEALRAYAARAGLGIIIEDDDEAKCGALPVEERPGLLRAIEQLESGDQLVVARRDRLARVMGAFVVAETMVRARGARIISTRGEGTEDDEPESVLMRMIFDAFSVYERLIIQKRTKSALQAKRGRGESMGRPPYGWRYKKKRLVPIEAEQGVVKRILSARLLGHTNQKIADDLNNDRIPTKLGRRWGAPTIRALVGVIKRRNLLQDKDLRQTSTAG